MHHVNNDGVRLAYRVYGQGDPLVLVHGWSCEGRYWDEFGYVDQLSTEYQVVVPDLRGHGNSGVPPNMDFSDEAFSSQDVEFLTSGGISSVFNKKYTCLETGTHKFKLTVSQGYQVEIAPGEFGIFLFEHEIEKEIERI